MNTVAMIVIPLYLVAIILSVILIGRKNKSYKDFSVGGGSLPWYVTAGSMVAATIGGGTLIGYAGSYYSFGAQWVWMAVITLVAQVILAKFLATRFKNFNIPSIADIIAVRYDKRARCVTAIILLVGEFAVFCAMVSSFAGILSSYIGLSRGFSLIITVVIFLVTVNMGGFKGIAYTDFIQTFLIIGGILIVTGITFARAGGFAGIASLGSDMLNPFHANIPWQTMLGNLVSIGLLCFVNQCTTIQKIAASKSPKDAQKAVMASSIASSIAVGGFLLIMGLGAKILHPDMANPDDVVMKLLNDMPVFISTLYAAAIVAAILTTANAMLISSSLSLNALLKAAKPEISDAKQLVSSKIYIVLAGVLAYVFVQFIPGIITWIMLAYTIQASLFIPLYAGLIWKRPTATAGFISLLFSGLVVGIWEVLGCPMGIHTIFVAVLTGILALVIVTLLDKKPVTSAQLRVVEAFRNGTAIHAEELI